MQNQTTEPEHPPTESKAVLRRLYLSHTLSAWNSRTFEFGAVLFLAKIFPGTLFYASCYALVRAFSAVVLSGYIGRWVDQYDRLKSVRASIVFQRIPVALSCLVFLFLKQLDASGDRLLLIAGFAAAALLACFEKLAIIANTVAVERDWVVVVANEVAVEREVLNATMRRIDLLAKLLAPVFISLVDDYSSTAAVWVVFCQNALSVTLEYWAIAQVYRQIPGLERNEDRDQYSPITSEHSQSLEESPQTSSGSLSSFIADALAPWGTYFSHRAFLASLSLSILYLTVLSTGIQMQTFLFTLGFTSLSVSLMRLAAVFIELLATWAAPLLMNQIGPIRSGLWFINQQLFCVLLSVALFLGAPSGTQTAGWSLMAGVTFSRLGLWGFDLSVQFLVQEEVPEDSRGKFSAAEAALQNVAELLSFAMTSVYSSPEEFKYPVYISAGAVAVAAACFAAFVRKRRGHLMHTDRCIRREKYSKVPQDDTTSQHSSEQLP